ncbi:MAG: TlpA family protein disulfide reductase [Microbacteriaceae bacterium]
MKLIRIAAVLTAASILLSGCASDPLAEHYRKGDNKNYIAGDGTVSECTDPATRKQSQSWTSITESGGVISSADLKGQVVVLNFWYAGCAPCRAEAKDLQALKDEFAGQGVQVLGVNVRDTAPTILAFARNFELDYPSVVDAASGDVMLAYTGIVTPQAVPTTLVLDKNSGVSARILGRFEKSILKTLVKTALEEKG